MEPLGDDEVIWARVVRENSCSIMSPLDRVRAGAGAGGGQGWLFGGEERVTAEVWAERESCQGVGGPESCEGEGVSEYN